MYAAWDIYKKNLIVLQPQKVKSNSRIDDLRMRDADDIPTAELIEIIGPTLALPMDKDLKSIGYAQQGDWLPFVSNTSKVIEKDTLDLVISLGSGVIIIGVIKALKMFITLLRDMVSKIPNVLLGTFILTLSYFLINARTRKWITDKFKSMITSIKILHKRCLQICLLHFSKWRLVGLSLSRYLKRENQYIQIQ